MAATEAKTEVELETGIAECEEETEDWQSRHDMLMEKAVRMITVCTADVL